MLEAETDDPATEAAEQTSTVALETQAPPVESFESTQEKHDAVKTERLGWSFALKIAAACIALIVLVGTISAFISQYRSRNKSSNTEAKSIAVLPFKNLSAESADETLGYGIADALIAKLGNAGRLSVRPTSAIERYSFDQSPLTVGRELQVDFVLEGNVQRNGDHVHVNARLLRANDGAQVWAGSFDERFTDIFTLQDRLSVQVAEALTIKLTDEERRRLAKHHTENAEAYEAYLRGRFFWNKRQTGQEQAKDYFQRAIEIDPNYAPAYAGLAEVLATERMPSLEAERAARRALEIDDTLAEAHAALGFIRMFHYWDFAAAERELRRAIELRANYSTAHQWYALLLAVKGQPEEAKARMRRALEIDPLSVGINADMGLLLFFNREYDEAIRQCRKTLELDSDFVFAHYYLYWIYFKKGMQTEAFDELLAYDRIVAAAARQPFDDGAFREAYAAGGMKGFLRAKLQGTLAAGAPFKYSAAEYYTLLGEKDEAIEWLRRSVNEPNSFFTIFVGVNPIFDDVRPDPRYQDLIRNAGLA